MLSIQASFEMLWHADISTTRAHVACAVRALLHQLEPPLADLGIPSLFADSLLDTFCAESGEQWQASHKALAGFAADVAGRLMKAAADGSTGWRMPGVTMLCSRMRPEGRSWIEHAGWSECSPMCLSTMQQQTRA